MILIWLLFIVQTLLIIASYHVFFPTIAGINLDSLIYFIHVTRLHQIVNIAILVGVWVNNTHKLVNVYYYFKSRNLVGLLIAALLYIILLFIYLEVSPKDYLYRHGLFVVVAFCVIGLPYLLPKESEFKNPIGFKKDEFNFVLYGKGGQILPILSPQKGIFISGIQGSGKTKSVIEPMLAQMINNGYCGILYDYDFSPTVGKSYSLTHLAYRALQEYNQKEKTHRRLISINFQDLTTSSRFNPFAPKYIEDRKNLMSYVATFLSNLNPEEARKNDFWYKNTYALLISIIVYLSNNYPAYCTLPHAMVLGKMPIKKLIYMLAKDEESLEHLSPVLDALEGSSEQLTGVTSSFKTLLQKLSLKDFFWILSGNDVPIHVNDPADPLIVCLGNNANHTKLISPLLATMANVLLDNMYSHGRIKSFLCIDELPRFYLHNLSEVPATARKYGVSTIVALQELTQLEESYSHTQAKVIKNIFGYRLFGKASPDDGDFISKFMGKKEVETISTTKSNKQTSTTTHQKEVPLISPEEARKLKLGEFIGQVEHKSGGFFRMELETVTAYNKRMDYKYMQPLPVVHEDIDVDANFNKIKAEAKEIIES